MITLELAQFQMSWRGPPNDTPPAILSGKNRSVLSRFAAAYLDCAQALQGLFHREESGGKREIAQPARELKVLQRIVSSRCLAGYLYMEPRKHTASDYQFAIMLRSMLATVPS